MKELSHLEFVTKSSNILSLKFKYLVFILYNDQLCDCINTFSISIYVTIHTWSFYSVGCVVVVTAVNLSLLWTEFKVLQ